MGKLTLFLLLHLVETVLLAASKNLSLGQTNTSIGLEHLLGDSAAT